MESTFIGQQNEIRNDYENEDIYTKTRWSVRSLLCRTSILGWLFVTSFSIVVPFLTFYLVVDLGFYKKVDTFTCFVNETFRVPCANVNISEKDCVTAGCCYDFPTKKCYHYLPSRYSYDFTGSQYKASRSFSPYGTKSVPVMKISINERTIDKVSVYLHQESDAVSTNILNKTNYLAKKADEKLMVEIFRPDGELMLSTARGPLIASNNYWEWTVHLTNAFLFGLGQSLILPQDNSTLTKVFYKNKYDHSTSPVVWAYSEGRFHGLTIHHEGPLEVTVLRSNLLVVKSLTGGTVELELSVGPTPQDLHGQQLGDVNSEFEDIPLWVLQTHFCKRNNRFFNVSALLEDFTDSTADSYCVDENFLMGILAESINNTDSKMQVNEILMNYTDKKFLLSIPPQILEKTSLYQSAEKYGIMYKFNGTTYKGTYLEQNVSYPDYSHENIQQYIQELDDFLADYFFNVTIDGIVLTDNWPINEEFQMDNSSFPYFTKQFQRAMSYTMQWNTTINGNLHIQKHNSYGSSHYQAFKDYYKSKNKIVLSSTKSISQPGPTVIENVNASWSNLEKHLLNILFESISGNHLVSLPVCGDTKDFNQSLQERLCLRWYMIAATMPMLRISTPQPWRNPDGLTTIYSQNTAKSAINIRNMLLPYYYYIIKNKEPLVRPMFYDFYENPKTFSLSEQYMIGKQILVVNPLTAGRTKMTVYLPSGTWYEFWGGEKHTTNKTNPWITVTFRETDFLAFIAEGSVIPMKSTTEKINVQVYLNNTKTEPTAEGFMQIHNIPIIFTANENSITVKSNVNEPWTFTLGYIKLLNAMGTFSSYVKNIEVTENTINIPYADPPTTTTESTTTEETTTEKITTPTTTTSSIPTSESTLTTTVSTTQLTTDSATTTDSTAESPTGSSSKTTSEATTSTATTTDSTTESPTGSSSKTTAEATTSTATTTDSTTESPTGSSSKTTAEATTSTATTTDSTTESPTGSSSKTTAEATTSTATTTDSTTESPTGSSSKTTAEATTSTATTTDSTTESPTGSSSKTTAEATTSTATTTDSTTESPTGSSSKTTDEIITSTARRTDSTKEHPTGLISSKTTAEVTTSTATSTDSTT